MRIENHWLRLILLGAVALLSACTTGDDKKASARPKDPNQIAYCTTEAAIAARSFQAAKGILDEVKMSSVTDQDLLEYVQYSRDVVSFCVKCGIERQSEPTLGEVLRNLHWADLLTLLGQRALTGGIAGGTVAGPSGAKVGVITAVGKEAAGLASDGWKLYKGLDRFNELDDQLKQEYSCN
jgi:hypothetical protein